MPRKLTIRRIHRAWQDRESERGKEKTMTEDVRDGMDSPKNPVKVIRLKCRDCTNNQISEIDNCTVKACPLYLWRFGKNPYRQKKIMSEEDRAKAKIRLAKAREKSKNNPI